MFSENGVSFADVAAMTRQNDGMYGGNMWVWLLIILMFTGGYGGGNGVFGRGNATASGITDGYVLTSDFANIERELDGINNGICSLGYDQLGQMNGINRNIDETGAAIQRELCQSRYDMASQFANLNYNMATQSCQTQRAIADSTTAIIANQDANTRSIIDYLTADKIATLSAENQGLKFAASQAAQNAYLINALSPHAQPAYVVPNPYTGATGFGYNCSCAG